MEFVASAESGTESNATMAGEKRVSFIRTGNFESRVSCCSGERQGLDDIAQLIWRFLQDQRRVEGCKASRTGRKAARASIDLAKDKLCLSVSNVGHIAAVPRSSDVAAKDDGSLVIKVITSSNIFDVYFFPKHELPSIVAAEYKLGNLNGGE